jgi:hypothetical protein
MRAISPTPLIPSEAEGRRAGRVRPSTSLGTSGVVLMLLLAACGRKADLRPSDGTLPPAPYGVQAPLTAEQMLDPPPQAAPERVDDPVKRSEERREDRFELPPQ